jgi:hypothetical protein
MGYYSRKARRGVGRELALQADAGPPVRRGLKKVSGMIAHPDDKTGVCPS